MAKNNLKAKNFTALPFSPALTANIHGSCRAVVVNARRTLRLTCRCPIDNDVIEVTKARLQSTSSNCTEKSSILVDRSRWNLELFIKNTRRSLFHSKCFLGVRKGKGKMNTFGGNWCHGLTRKRLEAARKQGLPLGDSAGDPQRGSAIAR